MSTTVKTEAQAAAAAIKAQAKVDKAAADKLKREAAAANKSGDKPSVDKPAVKIDIKSTLAGSGVELLAKWRDGMPKAKGLTTAAYAKLYVEHANTVFALGLSLDNASGKNFKSLKAIVASGLRDNKRIKKQYTTACLRSGKNGGFGADYFRYEFRALSSDK